MKRCTSCFRYSLGTPTFCAYCGRSFDVRLCPRGHRNPRTVTFCAECGSNDLSTASPPPTMLFRVSQWAIRSLSALAIAIVIVTIVAGLVASVDWSVVVPKIGSLAIVLGFFYWTTTLLPGPVRKVGRALGRTAVKAIKGKAKRK